MADTQRVEGDESETTEERSMRACKTIVLAGIHLIKSGYGKMGLLPYVGGAGFWRCTFHPLGKPNSEFFRYTSGSETKYLADHCGGSIRSNISPKRLAKAIMQSVPEWVKDQCRDEPTPETLRWLEMLLGYLEKGYLPQAFHEYSTDLSRWKLVAFGKTTDFTIPPQPGYIYPGDVPAWSDTPFWKPLVAHRLAIEGGDDAFAATWDYLYSEEVEHIARELASAMRENNEAAAADIFRAAIAGVDLAFRKESGRF